MDYLQETWIGFFVAGLVLVGFLQLIAKSRTTVVQPGMATKSDQFSMSTVFFSVRSGEAPLFFTVLTITVCFFLFSLGLARDILSIFPT